MAQPMVSFKLTTPEQTEILWPLMKGLIEEIRSRNPEKLDWKPEDVMLQLAEGYSRLTILYDKGQSIGYFIFRIVGHEITRKPSLQIWLGGLFPDCRKGIRELKIIMAEIADWCQREYPMALEFISRRRGWERVLKDILPFHYAVYGREARP